MSRPLGRTAGIVCRFIALTLALCLGMAPAAPAQALYPQIIYDSTAGPGQNIYGPQGLHFTGGVGFTVSAKALAITFDGITYTPLVNGTVDFHASYLGSTIDAGMITGHFTGVGGPLPDLIVADVSGVLAGTNYWNRTVWAALGASQADTDSRFTVVAGSLAPWFDATGGQGRNTGMLSNIVPLVSATTFAQDFSADIAGYISPVIVVPEPATAGLLSAGLVLLVLLRRFFTAPAAPGGLARTSRSAGGRAAH